MNLFHSIFEKYDTDKTLTYSQAYEESFTPMRDEVKLVFEVGVNRGGSVRAWKEYFPNALIVGIDIGSHTYFEDPDNRIKIEIGNGTSKEFMENLVRKYGRPDIVIDDGSHMSSDIKATYAIMAGHTNICYVMEDLGTQFYEFVDKNTGGLGNYVNDSIPATKLVQSEVEQLLIKPSSISSVRVYYSIAFLFMKRGK